MHFCAVLHIFFTCFLVLPHCISNISRTLTDQSTIGAFQILIAYLVQGCSLNFLFIPGRDSKAPTNRYGVAAARAAFGALSHMMASFFLPPASICFMSSLLVSDEQTCRRILCMGPASPCGAVVRCLFTAPVGAFLRPRHLPLYFDLSRSFRSVRAA